MFYKKNMYNWQSNSAVRSWILPASTSQASRQMELFAKNCYQFLSSVRTQKNIFDVMKSIYKFIRSSLVTMFEHLVNKVLPEGNSYDFSWETPCPRWCRWTFLTRDFSTLRFLTRVEFNILLRLLEPLTKRKPKALQS